MGERAARWDPAENIGPCPACKQLQQQFFVSFDAERTKHTRGRGDLEQLTWRGCIRAQRLVPICCIRLIAAAGLFWGAWGLDVRSRRGRRCGRGLVARCWQQLEFAGCCGSVHMAASDMTLQKGHQLPCTSLGLADFSVVRVIWAVSPFILFSQELWAPLCSSPLARPLLSPTDFLYVLCINIQHLCTRQPLLEYFTEP